MPVITHVYRGDRERHYPYPPICRVLAPGDEIDLDPADVPKDIPLEPKAAPRESGAADKPPAAGRRGRTARTSKEG